MRQLVVSILDHATGAYSRPVFVPTEAAAIRSFRDEVNRDDASNDLFRHSGDFDLFRIGTFDDSTGLVTSEAVPVLLIKGLKSGRNSNHVSESFGESASICDDPQCGYSAF